MTLRTGILFLSGIINCLFHVGYSARCWIVTGNGIDCGHCILGPVPHARVVDLALALSRLEEERRWVWLEPLTLALGLCFSSEMRG